MASVQPPSAAKPSNLIKRSSALHPTVTLLFNLPPNTAHLDHLEGRKRYSFTDTRHGTRQVGIPGAQITTVA